MKKGDHGCFNPNIFATGVTPNGTLVYTLLVVPPTRRSSRIQEAGRRRSRPASCGSLARMALVAGCVPDRKNEVVQIPPLVAIREADAGAWGVASRR